MRTWYLYNKPIEQKQYCKHIGILLSGNFGGHKRAQELVNKGKEIIASSMSVCVRPGGLNPICAAEIWKSVGLPKMLYACHLWWNLSQTDMDDLERVNRLAARELNVYVRPPNLKPHLGVWGFGLCKVLLNRNCSFCKNLLAHLLVLSTNNFLSSNYVVFFFNQVVGRNQGFVANIVEILQKYDLQHYLTMYMDTREFPQEFVWKRLVRNTIYSD